MSYEIGTPILRESVEMARRAAEGVLAGAMEPKHANTVLSAARTFQGAVRTDVQARLARPRIERFEIEADRQRQAIAAPAAA